MIPNSLIEFVNSLDQYDWFCDAEVDHFGRFVVYINKMDINFIGKCPNYIGGYHVLFHFAVSQPPSKIVSVSDDQEYMYSSFPIEEIPFLSDDDVENDVDDLIMELDRLEKVCGSNILQDIFYEIHDGKNAVTNASSRFPEVRGALDVLYDQYGFDVIYEELDG